jgi:predicted enzyme related to lactoylglutathione lyase
MPLTPLKAGEPRSKMKLGYTLLYVDDVEKSMAFYSKAFGLEASFLQAWLCSTQYR